VDHGYPEALVRGFRKSFLTEDVYNSLKACNTLADFKLVLEDTDYNGCVSQHPDLVIADLKSSFKRKLADEMDHLAAQSVEPLTSFLELLRHGYQIENVLNMIEGVKNNVDPEILLKRADPLGEFEQLKNIRMVDGDDYGSLYETVLIDLPIGKYFR
jgi:V-type H+-transporting ATPase subunit d